MLEIFEHGFMQRAFLIALLIAVITPCIGVIIVLKRLSMIGDSLSHSSLAGVAAGLVGGFNPILGAAVFSIAAAFGIERVRKSFPQYAEISLAVIMSTGIGLAGVLSGFVKNGSSFDSFLFGSIVAVSNFELLLVVALSFVVILTLLLLFKELFYLTFDEEAARLAGVPVQVINFIFTLLTAVTVSVSARVVGTLVISSLMVLPVAAAMQISRSYKQTVAYSVVFAVFSTITGLFVSYYADFKPGGTIVLISVAVLGAAALSNKAIRRVWRQKAASL